MRDGWKVMRYARGKWCGCWDSGRELERAVDSRRLRTPRELQMLPGGAGCTLVFVGSLNLGPGAAGQAAE